MHQCQSKLAKRRLVIRFVKDLRVELVPQRTLNYLGISAHYEFVRWAILLGLCKSLDHLRISLSRIFRRLQETQAP